MNFKERYERDNAPERLERMKPILDRIPDIWGKYLPGAEWDDILLELDAKMAELDPDYVLYQAKEKFGGLRYYFHTDTEHGAEMEELVTAAERAVAELEREKENTP